MEAPKKDDILLLADEKFDFDLSLSSLSANEDDEVFFGPVGHKERCIAASLELNSQSPDECLLPTSENHLRWSPLTGEKFVEVYKEAHLLALQIESSSRSQVAHTAGPGDTGSQVARTAGPGDAGSQVAHTAGPGDAGSQVARTARPGDAGSQSVERFIQESRLKMSLFEKENKTKKSPKSLKRETYCLADSPLRGPQDAPAQASLAQMQGPLLSSHSSPVKPRPIHLPNQAVTQKKIISKLLPPRASSLRGKSMHLAVEKPMKDKPTSPSKMKTLNEKKSHKDVPPGKPSSAQDVASLPASRSRLAQGKRSLPVPNKLGPKKTLLKPPGCADGLARKSSSWGSVSSVSSNVCASPAAGRAKSSEHPGFPADSSRPPSNPSQSGRAGATVTWPSLRVGPAAACGQSRCPTLAVDSARQPTAPTTLALTQPQTPEQGGPKPSSPSSLSRSSQRDNTGKTRRDAFLNSKAKVAPTPTNQFKIPKFPTGEAPDSVTPRFPRAQRPQSCTSAGRVVHSTPVRRSSGPASGTPVSMRRMSTLPTPVPRRLSGLPLLTPKTVPRIPASPLCVSARQLSSEPRKKPAVRAAPMGGSSSQAASGGSDEGGFSPPAAVPQALSFSPEKSDFTFPKSVATELTLDEAQPPAETSPNEALLVDIQLDQLCVAPKATGSPLVDLPLIDFCNPPEANVVLGSESRPLIDLLVNTPNSDRNTVSKPLHEVGQLIDLGSPLIQLSPEANKENVDSPLLKF